MVCEFFLPDSSQFYRDQLRGENYLRYVPNANHSMYGTDVLDTAAAFHWLIANDRRPPRFSWMRRADGALQVMPLDQPQSVLLWQATNPEARDFRLAILGPALPAPRSMPMIVACIRPEFRHPKKVGRLGSLNSPTTWARPRP